MSNKLLKDTLLGNITFSKFEGLIFSNQLFNRLHYITQNSMAFRVFPSDKTSRFSHCTGVMHISSMMFQNGLSNANKITMKAYLEEKGKDPIENIIMSSLDSLDGFDSDKVKEILLTEKEIDFNKLYEYLELFYGAEYINQVSFYNDVFDQKKNIVTYLLLLSAVRIFGLLHDIGHLPFSHLSEYALEELAHYIQDEEETKEVSGNIKDVSMVLKMLTENKNKIHEIIGDKLISIVFNQLKNVIKKTIKNEEECAFNILFCLILQEILKEIRKAHNGKLFCLYSIVSSEFDSDRLDFIMRDGLASGLIDKTGDFERIIKMYCLTSKDKKYFFLPAVQALNDIQEILTDRFRIYRYLINHHKVKKMDYLLQTSLFYLMKKELNDDQNSNIILSDHIDLNAFIDIIGVLKKILETKPDESIERTCYQFSQITDNWAFTILNRKYSKILSTFHDADKENSNDLFLKYSLDEIFTGTKCFESLWKRDYDYHEFLKILNKSLSDETMDKIINMGKDIKLFAKNEDITKDKYSVALIKYLDTAMITWKSKIEKQFYENGVIVLLVKPKLKIGISDLMLIDLKNQDTFYKFKEMSETYNYLVSDLEKSTQFYVFYKKNHEDNEGIRDDLVNYIIEIINDHIKNKEEEIGCV